MRLQELDDLLGGAARRSDRSQLLGDHFQGLPNLQILTANVLVKKLILQQAWLRHTLDSIVFVKLHRFLHLEHRLVNLKVKHARVTLLVILFAIAKVVNFGAPIEKVLDSSLLDTQLSGNV